MDIRLAGVTKVFEPDIVALEDIYLSIDKGEFVYLVGTTGSGKTTLLMLLSREYIPTRGQITVGDVNLRKIGRGRLPFYRRDVGVVFQDYKLLPNLTVFENVAFGLRVKPRGQRPAADKIRQRVAELLDLVQLSALANRYPTQLSGGQRQRIALARALAVEPRVLLLDEPFGALDARVRKELRRWLRTLHDALHITSIFVTHDQEEALEVSDRVVVMNQGRVEQIGTPAQVYEHPATPFVYSFLGAVNLFHGRVHGCHLHMGADNLHVGHHDLETGAEALGFVRPHELDIETNLSERSGIAARVERVMALGATARVELTDADPKSGRYYEVELSRERVAALKLDTGQRVRLRPARIRLFAPGPQPAELNA